MRIFPTANVCLILTVIASATPAPLSAAGKRTDGGLKWTSPQSSVPQTITSPPAPANVIAPLETAPADSSLAQPVYQDPQGAYPTHSYPAASSYPYQAAPQNSTSGGGGHLPGGPNGRVGHPYYYTPQTYDPAWGYAGNTDPYTLHFGPGYYRSNEYGHHRFPYYSYRRPWYFPGHTSYNRDTNLPW